MLRFHLDVPSAQPEDRSLLRHIAHICALLIFMAAIVLVLPADCQAQDQQEANQAQWKLLSTQWDNGKLMVNFRCQGKRPRMSISAGDPVGNESERAKVLPGQVYQYFKNPKQSTGYKLRYFGVSSHPSEVQLRNDLKHVPISSYLYVDDQLSATIPGIKPNAKGRFAIHCQPSSL